MNTSPQRLAIAYFATMAAFLALDAVWLSLMASRLYQPAIGHLMAPDVDWLAAALFYPLYILGLLVFAVRPALVEGRAAPALRLGALFGLIGLVSFGAGFLIDAWLAFLWAFRGESLSNRPLLILGVLLMLAGLQVLTTGLLAEMTTHRTFQCSDSYSVREVLD